MRLFSLGERLSLCASMVRPGALLADVGTDHAYLPVWMARNGLIRRAVASDVRAGPLERAKKNIERYGVGNLVAVRLSDGLDAVQPSEAEDIVVAGMGGLMIAEIISRAPWLKEGGRHLILQPMTRAEDLRRSLSDQGFAILRERAVREEHHLYTAMLCAYSPGRRGKGLLFPYLGGLNASVPEDRSYLLREGKRLRAKADGLRLQGDTAGAARLFSVLRELEALVLTKETEG